MLPSMRPVNSGRIVPVSPPSIDPDNDLAQGLVGAWLPGITGGVDLTGIGQPLTAGTNIGFGAGLEGQALSSLATFAGYTGAASSHLLKWNAFSVYWRGFQSGTPDNNSPYVNISYDATNTTPFFVTTIQVNGIGTQINYQWNSGGASANFLGTSGLPPNGGMIDLAATFVVGGNVNGYFNGAANGSAAFGASAPNFLASLIGIATHAVNNNTNPNALTFCVYAWNRALLPSEIQALHDDPYSFFSVKPAVNTQTVLIPPLPRFALNSDPPIFPTTVKRSALEWVMNDVFLPKKRVFLTSGTAWVVPADYNIFNNQIECIGGGAGGDAVGGAGGGGAYASIFNLNLFPGATAAIQVGAAGAAGNPGTDTWLKSTVTVLAKGGGAPTTTTGGAGGDSGTSIGFSVAGGGPGGSVGSGNPGGGGGAGGPRGGGGNGFAGGVSLGGNGGTGDNGFGGTGGAGSAAGTNPGNPGTEYDATHGGGGGGGGSITNTGGGGGNYGGGGGGSLVTGGAGAPGLIIITYTPATVAPLGGWALNSDPPLPPGPLKQLFQSDLGMRFLSPAASATPISGMAWFQPVENPQVKGSSVKLDRYTDSTQPITFVLAQISGMAWWKPFEQPKFGPVAPDKMTNTPSFGTINFTAGISGMAWWIPFVQPFFPTTVKFWEHQTELMAPPLATIYVMASASDDQPQIKTWQNAWLAPQSAIPFNTLPGPVGISGMAWYLSFDQPRFPTSFKPEEYPAFFATVIPGTLPAAISGMAWYGSFDQPRFSTAYSALQQPQEVFTPQNFVTISDVNWYRPFEQPRFATAYPVASQSSQAFSPPPVLPTGIAWYVNLDQPFFPGLFKAHQQPPSAFVTAQTILPTGISGMAWNVNFEQPFFPTSYKAWLQPSFFEDLTPATDPVGISGMAWFQPFVQPFFKTAYKSELVPGTFSALTPSTLPAGISGMAWYGSFDQPKFSTAINASVQNYTTAWLYKPSPVVASLLQPIRISIGVGTGIDWTRGT